MHPDPFFPSPPAHHLPSPTDPPWAYVSAHQGRATTSLKPSARSTSRHVPSQRHRGPALSRFRKAREDRGRWFGVFVAYPLLCSAVLCFDMLGFTTLRRKIALWLRARSWLSSKMDRKVKTASHAHFANTARAFCADSSLHEQAAACGDC